MNNMITIVKNIVRSLKFFIAEPSCQVGIIVDSNTFTFDKLGYTNKIRWIENPKYGWYADPFILDVDDIHITLLVEHFSYKTQKGFIDKITINKFTFKVVSAITILDLDTHLSYPNILRLNDDIYIYPENCQSGNLILYKYNQSCDTLKKETILVQQPLIDSCIEYINGSYYLFSTSLRETTEESDQEVIVYKSNEATGPYQLYQTIKYDKPYGRGAGSFVYFDNMTIRPSQNGDGSYGKEVIFSEVTMNDGVFKFKELKRIGPPRCTKWTGIHTFNTYLGVAVVDGITYRRGPLISCLMKVYNKFFK